MIFSKAFLPLAAAMALIGASSVAAVSHGLAWPGETSGGALANSAASGSIRWYFHYDQGGVPGFENIEWVPTYYAPRLYDQWQAVKNVINGGYRPNTIMAFNEPDNQNPISPSDAAAQWNQELRPYQQQGIRISSPQIAYDLGWLSSFMSILQNQYGASPDVIAIHFYGSADDNGLNGLRNYVGQVQSQYPGKAIFVSELGVQAANNPSEDQVFNWYKSALGYLDSVGVERVAWFGAFPQNANPAPYVSNYNALFTDGNGSQSRLGYDYIHS
ncbi:hypothetical protein V8E36_008141 [Tilletia maclaganii]